MKVAAAHHPIIQKAVDELLSKGVIEPSSGGAGFYLSVFIVPKFTGSLQPLLNLKWFNHYLHIPSFKILLSDMSGSLFSMVIMLSPWISRMLTYIFLLLSNIVIFRICMPYQWEILPFVLATAPMVFTAFTKPILFLWHHKGFHIVICLDDILVLVHSKWAGKRAHSFLCS